MTVGIACVGFSCGEYLLEAVHSIQAQSDLKWRCAIVYDPSEHGDVIADAVKDDSRFTLVPSKPVDVCTARNRGYSEIEGELIFALDGDDILGPRYVAAVRHLMNRPQVTLAYTGTRLFGDREAIKTEVGYSPRLLAIRNMIVSSAMIRRKDFDNVGGYDLRVAALYEDWELWISILKKGGSVAFDPFPHFLYRQRPGSRSRSTNDDVAFDVKNYIFEKHRDFCWHTPKSQGNDRRLRLF